MEPERQLETSHGGIGRPAAALPVPDPAGAGTGSGARLTRWLRPVLRRWPALAPALRACRPGAWIPRAGLRWCWAATILIVPGALTLWIVFHAVRHVASVHRRARCRAQAVRDCLAAALAPSPPPRREEEPMFTRPVETTTTPRLRALLRTGLFAVLAFALVACGSTSEGTRSDRVEAAVEEGCPVAIPGATVVVHHSPLQSEYRFTTDDPDEVAPLRAAVAELAARYGEAEETAAPDPYDAAGDIGHPRHPGAGDGALLSRLSATTTPTEDGATLLLSVADRNLGDDLQAHVDRHMDHLRTGSCPDPRSLGR